MKRIFAFLALLAVLFLPSAKTEAAEPIDDWIIRNFESDITLNTDNSLTIEEKIVADCGSLPDKHGIFRILPLNYQKTDTETVRTPIELLSITDFKDNPISFSISKQSTKGIRTITWKIGSPDKTVTGINNFKITYTVKNVVRSDNNSFDELYWNLNGNFWEIPIEKFSATLHLPKEINKDNADLSLYSGAYGKRNNGNATINWVGPNTLMISNDNELNPGEGITLSLTFDKNIITEFKPSFWEKNGFYFFYLLPIIALLLCYYIWQKYGKDPKINTAIAPEFEIPENLSPILMGAVQTNGSIKNQYLSAEIIYLAAMGIIEIRQIKEKKLLVEADYELSLIKNADGLHPVDRLFIKKVFESETPIKTIKLSDLKNEFYQKIPSIKNATYKTLVDSKLITKPGNNLRIIFFVMGILIAGLIPFGLSFIMDSGSNWIASFLLSLSTASAIFIFFAIIMPKRTREGAWLNHRIKGFQLYMETAEIYRQQFNEKENIFEKFLPYAVMFGMTKKWIEEMEKIYGQEYMRTYHPVWFYGMNGSTFDFNAFAANIDSVTTQMATTMASNPSSSGSGGGGFSGGGGGGGGGGGW